MEQKIIITISRQYGSGGRLVAKKLAQALNIAFYDNELISLAAEKSGISQKYFADAEAAPVGNILLSLSTLTPSAKVNEIYGLPINEKVFLVQSQIIKELAEKKSCVIVGRCADYILKDFAHCSNIFIQADMGDRVKRALNEYGLSSQHAESMVSKTDKRRANYYNYFTNNKWGNINNYDLVLNTSKIGIDSAAEIIKSYVQLKEDWLAK